LRTGTRLTSGPTMSATRREGKEIAARARSHELDQRLAGLATLGLGGTWGSGEAKTGRARLGGRRAAGDQ
jgi:hypothetical protein